MPWTNIAKAKKAGAITTFRKKPLSLAAINKLYDVYDSIKTKGKAGNAMAMAMSTWKSLVVLKNATWVLKPKKESKEQAKEQTEVNEIPLPAGASRVGDGSFETFKDRLRDALKALLGGEKNYLYIVATYRTKVVVEVERGGTAAIHYEIPYKVKKGQFDFGSPVKVVKITKFQKAEQKRWQEYKEGVRAFVRGKATIADVVGSGIKITREAL